METIEIRITVNSEGNLYQSFSVLEFPHAMQMMIGQKIIGMIAMENEYEAVKAAGIDVSMWKSGNNELAKTMTGV